LAKAQKRLSRRKKGRKLREKERVQVAKRQRKEHVAATSARAMRSMCTALPTVRALARWCECTYCHILSLMKNSMLRSLRSQIHPTAPLLPHKETPMPTVTSKDGTTIAFTQIGQGPAVILVDGATGFRWSSTPSELAQILASDFTVYSYDRRGR